MSFGHHAPLPGLAGSGELTGSLTASTPPQQCLLSVYSTTKSVPGPKLCFQVMLAHLLLGSTVTFHMDCSSGAGGRLEEELVVRRGQRRRQTDRHTGGQAGRLCAGPDRAAGCSLAGQARAGAARGPAGGGGWNCWSTQVGGKERASFDP